MCLDSNQFLEKLNMDLICPLCQMILCIDCLMDNEKHIYCKQCISRWFDSGKDTCPVGNERINLKNLKIPKLVKNELLELEVKCTFRNNGCNVNIKYKNLEAHENRCPFNLVKCENGCGAFIKITDLRNHNCVEELRKLTEKLERQNKKLNDKNINLNTDTDQKTSENNLNETTSNSKH